MNKIILASQSPRRRDLLEQMGVVFSVVPSKFREQLDNSRPPDEVAIELALGKAKDVAAQFPDHVVIGSDTVVTIAGEQLEKPPDIAAAREMLRSISGKPHIVSTGIAVVWADQSIELTEVASAWVVFKNLNETAIEAYLATGDSLDKAGGYGIQSGAADLINYVVGDFDVIIGLPTKKLAQMLQENLGIKARAAHIDLPVRRIDKTS